MTATFAYKLTAEERVPQQLPALSSFQTESMLVSAFEHILSKVLGYDRWKVLREFEAADGIADVIYCELGQMGDRARLLGNVPPRWAYALRSLPYRKHFSVHDFALWTGASLRHSGVMLECFRTLGFCQPGPDRNTSIKVKRPQLVSTRIHAVEAKLRDWKRALRQAYRYLDYACQSWVLLDASSARAAISNIDDFVRLNVGLASLSSDGRIMIHFESRPSSPRSAMRFWQANAELARRLQSDV